MADEIITQPEPTPVVEQKPNPVEERITDLSSKVKIASEERDAALAKVAAAEKKAAFAEGFVGILESQPAAKEHRADIEAKVTAGLSLQDATYAVLGAAGKLGTPQVARQPIGGGSAQTPIISQADKKPDEMTRQEKRAALVELERTGVIGLN